MRIRIARQIAALLGKSSRVPGVHQASTKSRSWWGIAAAAASCTAAGCIVAQQTEWHDATLTVSDRLRRHLHTSGLLQAAAAETSAPGAAAHAVAAASLSNLVAPLGYLLQATDISQSIDVATGTEQLSGWQLSTLLWSFACLGRALTSDESAALASSLDRALSTLPLHDAIVSAWGLYMLQIAPDDYWERLLQHVARHAVKQELTDSNILYLLLTAMQHVSRAGALHQEPRPSREDIDRALQPLPFKIRRRCLEAYYEYVPLHPYIEGPYLVCLHMLATLPAAMAAMPSGRLAVSTADLEKVQQVLHDPRQLGKIKRDLFYHWRQDELVDARQKCVNDVAYILLRRMGVSISQPADVDVLVPHRRLAIFVDDSPSPAPTAQLGGAGMVPAAVLQDWVRDGFCPSTGFRVRALPGVVQNRKRLLQAAGWRVVTMSISEFPASASIEEKEKFLRGLLSGAL